MSIQAHSSKPRRGVAIVEFTLSMVFLVPLLLGVFIYGFKLVRSIQMQQIVRDLGHMYIRGINFRNPGPQQNARTLAAGFDLTNTGSSLVVLSKVRLITQVECNAGNAVSPTIPQGTPCANINKIVFVEQLTVGNPGNGQSTYGTPPLEPDYTVTIKNQTRTSTAIANGFATVLPLNSGEYAYVAEMINLTPELNIPGFSGQPQVYARAIF
jgi:Flp pilus assembly protein TadG